MQNPVIVFSYTGFTVHAVPSGAASSGVATEVSGVATASSDLATASSGVATEVGRGARWRGEILDAAGEVQDGFSYTRDGFPGAVIGALRVRDIAFAPQLAARMWVHTDDAE